MTRLDILFADGASQSTFYLGKRPNIRTYNERPLPADVIKLVSHGFTCEGCKVLAWRGNEPVALRAVSTCPIHGWSDLPAVPAAHKLHTRRGGHSL
jgi:hypothetical protein